jgi:hypothetical protein
MDKSMTSIVSFYRLIEQTNLPQRADRFAVGTLPTRASRYCDAVTSAAGFGWWVFPPMDFSLLWDGHSIFWHYEGLEDWLKLTAAQFPGQAAHFDAAAPASMQGCSPPFLTVLPEPGIVQIWSGLIARTAPDWSLLIRPLANLPAHSDFALFEGIVETDQWFGPLFTNIRLTRTHAAIEFRADYPLAQVQPIPRVAYAEETLNSMRLVRGVEAFSEQDWGDYYEHVVRPNDDHDRTPGTYAIAARKRRRCPMAA